MNFANVRDNSSFEWREYYLSETSIGVSKETLSEIDSVAPDVAKRGYVLRSKEDTIRALIIEFKRT